MTKRYAIVRVDGRYKHSHFEVNSIENINELKVLDKVKEYGDTKEQLIQKIDQELTRQVYKNNFRLKDIATKIVEFLGVE